MDREKAGANDSLCVNGGVKRRNNSLFLKDLFNIFSVDSRVRRLSHQLEWNAIRHDSRVSVSNIKSEGVVIEHIASSVENYGDNSTLAGSN